MIFLCQHKLNYSGLFILPISIYIEMFAHRVSCLLCLIVFVAGCIGGTPSNPRHWMEASRSMNLSVCDSHNDRDDCYDYVARSRGDVTACYGINSRDIRGECIYNYASEVKNLSLCDEIGVDNAVDRHWRDACYAEVAPSMLDVALCDTIKDVNYTDKCLTEFLYESHPRNVTICDTMSILAHKDKCLSRMGDLQCNDSICDAVLDDKLADSCYSKVAVSIRKPSLCDKIKNQWTATECTRSVAFYSMRNDWSVNITICDVGFRDLPEERDWCIKKVREEMLNWSDETCGKIRDPPTRNICLNKTAPT